MSSTLGFRLEGIDQVNAMIDTKTSAQPFEPKLTAPAGILLLVNSTTKGQALVEFTLIFVFLLILLWVPVDFGLAFYTGQIALNASREGARIAAADPNLVDGNCVMPCGSAPADSALNAAANRLRWALLPSATITVDYDPAGTGPACNKQVRVTVSGNYNFSLYQLFRLIGISVPDTTNIVRRTDMRWEHQQTCINPT